MHARPLYFFSAVILGALAAGAPPQEKSPELLKVSGDDLKSGLAAVYRGAGGTTLHRIDPKPAFAMGDSSPHPRLAPGPFEVVWDGAFVQPENDSIRFGAFVGGEIKVTLGGIVVLEGRGESENAWIEAKEMRPWTSGT